MRRLLIILATLGFAIQSASGEWRVDGMSNRMTDLVDRVASVSAKAPSAGISAQLQMQCLDNDLVGGRFVSVVFSARFTPGSIGVNYRIDDHPVRPLSVRVGTSLKSIDLLDVGHEFKSGRRFRLEVFPTGGPVLFYDFDITGADRAARAIPCTQRRATSTDLAPPMSPAPPPR